MILDNKNPIKLYNSLSNKLETFIPQNPDNVLMYACGPTVYDSPHIGNARSAVVFDILYRLLKYVYRNVTYVRNVTDIDDKINKKASDLGISIRDLTDKTLIDYQNDMCALGLLNPTYEPRATDHIDEMINIIKVLIEKQHAYFANGHVLFRVSSDKFYGILSNRSRDEMIVGARVEVASYKEDPLDFVLWKPSAADMPGFESPWGYGRPGWHIECSAMSAKYLGDSFDIHGGGQDLIFPHHENELAQSRCYSDKLNMSKYWVHNGMLLIDGQKMSKSLGNILTVRDLLHKYDGDVIKYFMLTTHYSKTLDWTESGIMQAKKTFEKLRNVMSKYYDNVAQKGNLALPCDDPIVCAICDNLNTSKVLTILYDIARNLNKGNANSEGDVKRLAAGMDLLGLLNLENRSKDSRLSDTNEIEMLIKERNQARAEKRFSDSDRIRDLLNSRFGVIVEDNNDGKSSWRLR